jgi:anti-sigma B factor antagonist
MLENVASTMGENGKPPVSVVSLPEEIDMTNAEDVTTRLRDAFVPGVKVVIADLTKTRFCDSAGVRGLTLVHQRAAASGSRLNLAVAADGAVSRVLHLMDLTSVLNVYSSVEAATAAARGLGR